MAPGLMAAWPIGTEVERAWGPFWEAGVVIGWRRDKVRVRLMDHERTTLALPKMLRAPAR